MLPTEVPTLVARCYGPDDIVPAAWADVTATARREWADQLRQRADRAEPHLLTTPGQLGKRSLEGLNKLSPAGDAEDAVRVRDGDEDAEVVLVVRDELGYSTLSGQRLGVNADDGLTYIDEVLGGTVRLPTSGRFKPLADEIRRRGTLPAWRDHEWLKHAVVVPLDSGHRTTLGDFRLQYDQVRGLTVVPVGTGPGGSGCRRST